jgi:hypothetical protein
MPHCCVCVCLCVCVCVTLNKIYPALWKSSNIQWRIQENVKKCIVISIKNQLQLLLYFTFYFLFHSLSLSSLPYSLSLYLSLSFYFPLPIFIFVVRENVERVVSSFHAVFLQLRKAGESVKTKKIQSKQKSKFFSFS